MDRRAAGFSPPATEAPENAKSARPGAPGVARSRSRSSWFPARYGVVLQLPPEQVFSQVAAPPQVRLQPEVHAVILQEVAPEQVMLQLPAPHSSSQLDPVHARLQPPPEHA